MSKRGKEVFEINPTKDIPSSKKHKEILKRYLPENKEVKELDLKALSLLPISLEQKIELAKEIWKK